MMENEGSSPERTTKQNRHFCTTNKCSCLLLLLVVVAIGIVAIVTFVDPSVRGQIPENKESLEWWKTSIIYQIYPRSFQDTDGDGIGDLQGIISRLYYLQELGIGAIWISPFYQSPMRDFGYDVTNYTKIDTIFGNMTDFEQLVTEAHARGIKVIIDFVPNHTSNESVWFNLSRTDDEYKDYYIWNPGKNETDEHGRPKPPNNWKSVFGGSAWEWDETRGEYYYHAFLTSQPDLNYRNPRILQEIDDALSFWLEKGVDGFRIDAIPYLFESSNVTLNEMEVENINVLVYDPNINTYTKNLDEVYDVLTRWKNLVHKHEEKTGKTIVLIAEAVAISQEIRDKYYKAGSVPFFFDLINAKDACGASSGCYAQIIKDGTNVTDGQWPNFVMGNHDQRRIADNKGSEYVDAMNMMLLTIPGTPTTYYGEELGMRGGNYTGMTPRDPYAITSNNLKNSRDSERNPMQWDGTQNAGFSDGEPWLPVTPNTDYQHNNVEAESKLNSSHLSIYKNLVRLRQLPAFQNSDIEFPTTISDILVYLRQDKNSRYLITINLSDKPHTISIGIPNTYGRIALSTQPRTSRDIELNDVTLKVGEGLVIELITN